MPNPESAEEELDWDDWVASLTTSARDAIATLKPPSSEPQDGPTTRPIPDGAFLSLRETARLLRVSQGKVLAWIKRGKIKALDVGRAGRPAYRIDRIALAKSLEVVPQASKARRRPRPKPGFIERY